jgi:hypothetical protein
VFDGGSTFTSFNLDSPFVITAPLAPLKAALNAQVDLDACFIL